MTPARDVQRPMLHVLRGTLWALLLCVAVVLVMVATYILIPTPDVTVSTELVITVGMVALLAYLSLAAWAVQRLQRARHPVVEGSVLVVIMATLIILGYSWVYLSTSAQNPASFTEPLTKVTAVYFTVTVLSTVGFGDITATTDSARMMVTSQMILGVSLLTVGIKLITQSARHAVEHRSDSVDPGSAALLAATQDPADPQPARNSPTPPTRDAPGTTGSAGDPGGA